MLDQHRLADAVQHRALHAQRQGLALRARHVLIERPCCAGGERQIAHIKARQIANAEGFGERALGALEEIAAHYPGRLEIVCADAMSYDPRPLLGGARAKIVANLPYNIATPLLIGWLETDPWPPWYDCMVLMFQREVAQRIVAHHDDGIAGVVGKVRCHGIGRPPESHPPLLVGDGAERDQIKAKLDAGQKASDEIRTSVSSLRAKGQNTAALEAEGRDLQASNARLQGALDRMNAALGKIEA